MRSHPLFSFTVANLGKVANITTRFTLLWNETAWWSQVWTSTMITCRLVLLLKGRLLALQMTCQYEAWKFYVLGLSWCLFYHSENFNCVLKGKIIILCGNRFLFDHVLTHDKCWWYSPIGWNCCVLPQWKFTYCHTRCWKQIIDEGVELLQFISNQNFRMLHFLLLFQSLFKTFQNSSSALW